MTQPNDQSKHRSRDQVLKTRSNTQLNMKKIHKFFLGFILVINGRFSQVTEVYTTVDPRENSGYIVNGGRVSSGDRKEIVSIQLPSQGSINEIENSDKSWTWTVLWLGIVRKAHRALVIVIMN